MNKLTVIIVLLVPYLSFCQNLQNEFTNLLDSTYNEHQDAVGVLMHIESPKNEISWSSAVGFSDKKTNAKLEVDQPVLIASNTKPYVAAAVLRLVEMNKFGINSPIKKLLKRKTRKLLKSDGYDLSKISIKHLLSHTSGIADYVDEDYFEFVNKNPKYQWRKSEQIQRTIDIGNPLSDPGSEYSYGDINYLLLTEIIEKRTKKPFYVAMKELLKFNDLGLNRTWFKTLESYPENTKLMAHQYSKEYDWDSYALNPSWDLYGGGGMATTVKEAALFFHYLFEGKIIEDKMILKEMYAYVLPKDESNYCLGLRNISFPTFSAYYHGGWWGTDVAYSPESGSAVAVFTLQKAKRGEFAKLSIEMMRMLAESNK